jgi:hypothetical protein
MKYRLTRYVLAAAIILLYAITPAICKAGGGLGIGFCGGYFLPEGEWTQHRYAPGVTQFGGGLQLALDLEFAIHRDWDMGFYFRFAGLDTGEWEWYVKQQGESIHSEAHMILFGCVMRPHIIVTPDQLTRIEFGLGLASIWGKEEYADLSYEYDFFGPADFAYLVGVEHDWFLDENIALMARAGIIFMPTAVNYADGVNQSVHGFPFSLGIRFFLK